MKSRAVTTGKEQIYVSRELGNIFVPTVKIKADPKSYVDSVIADRSTSKDQLLNRLQTLAIEESIRYTPIAGKKSGGQMFWRNALGYFQNKTGLKPVKAEAPVETPKA